MQKDGGAQRGGASHGGGLASAPPQLRGTALSFARSAMAWPFLRSCRGTPSFLFLPLRCAPQADYKDDIVFANTNSRVYFTSFQCALVL